jgi:CBS domain-containing protein
VTDQDNGIVFDAGQEGAESLRQGFLPFAKEVNRRLDECGFTYCKGNIMAGNPELCLSLDEWQAKYQSWLSSTSPQAVLNSTIFFDVRLLYGSNHLVEELVSWLTSRLPGATLFLRFMAMDALRTRPPLGFMNGFQFDQNKTFHGTLDLKTYGTRIYVDAARILALANGIPETSTIERLREASKKNMIAADDIEAIVSGFNHLQRLRLRVQKCATPMGLANRISPEQLNTIDRRILKECFKLAGKLQRGLKLEYDL